MRWRKLDKAHRWVLVVMVAWGVLGIVWSLVRLATGGVKSVDYARITEFCACEGPDPITGLPQDPITIVPSSMETIYACGHLQTGGRISLGFLIDYEGTAEGWFALNRRYETGYVFEEIPKRSWDKPGHYLVEAWWNRARLASMAFEVVEDHE
jgi:hypothetical protein